MRPSKRIAGVLQAQSQLGELPGRVLLFEAAQQVAQTVTRLLQAHFHCPRRRLTR